MFTDTRTFAEVLSNPQGILTEDAEAMLAAIVKDFGLTETLHMAEAAAHSSGDDDE